MTSRNDELREKAEVAAAKKLAGPQARPASARPGGRNQPQQEAEKVPQRIRPQSAKVRSEDTDIQRILNQPKGSTSTVPAWLEREQRVLRFYGYFMEPVWQSAYETERVRRIILYYYLADSSLHVAEPKQANSGMPQGVFVKRAVARKADGSLYEPNDFQIGSTINLVAREFHLVDADKQTREYFRAQLNQPLGDAVGYPADRHSDLMSFKSRPKNKMGSISQPKKNDTLRQFLEHDRHVLSFSCFWDDTNRLYGEKRKYILNYYLSNDTVEVREVLQPNSGRDPFPMLLRRQKLPKKIGHSAIVTQHDLRCGGSVYVYGRNIVLLDCDKFTKSYYRQQLGFEQVPALHLLSDMQGQPPKVPEPPYTGWGSREDSLQSHYSLNPKAPRKNLKKAQRMDRKVLRFRAKLLNPPVQDSSRRFTVSFFLSDDTFSVYEPVQRNSGITGGKFLERGKYRHMQPANGSPPRFFQAGDFFVGAVIPLEFSPHQQLQLLEADSFTLKYCEGNPRVFPMSNVDIINMKLLRALMQMDLANFGSADLRELFRMADSQRRGHLIKDAFCEQLQQLGLLELLCQQEIVTLLRHYDESSQGVVLYNEWCDDLSRTYFGVEDPGVSSAHTKDRLMTQLRSDKTCIRKVFRRVTKDRGPECDGEVNEDEWLDLLDFYNVDISPDEAIELFQLFDARGQGCINYNDFCDELYPCLFKVDTNHHSAGRGPENDGDYSDSTAGIGQARSAWGEPSPTGEGALHTIRPLLRDLFGDRKYELRNALRAVDQSGAGRVNEDAFMHALSRANDRITDEMMFQIANVFFTSPSSTIDINEFLKAAFSS